MAMALRGGTTVQVNARDLARGDLVVLNTGDKVAIMHKHAHHLLEQSGVTWALLVCLLVSVQEPLLLASFEHFACCIQQKLSYVACLLL
jgi:hypothetical protein